MNYTKAKVPHFFIYAKKKDISQVEKVNESVVNRLEKIIPNPNLNFKAMNLGNFDYKKLMRNKDTKLDESIIGKYVELDLRKRFMMNRDNTEDIQNIAFLYDNIKSEILKINNDIYYVVDVLVKYLYEYKKSSYKTSLWECFGDIIIENLRNNIKQGYMLCEKCGKRVKITSNNRKFCIECWKEYRNNYQKELMRKRRSKSC